MLPFNDQPDLLSHLRDHSAIFAGFGDDIWSPRFLITSEWVSSYFWGPYLIGLYIQVKWSETRLICLLTTKFSCLQKNNFGHTIVQVHCAKKASLLEYHHNTILHFQGKNWRYMQTLKTMSMYESHVKVILPRVLE